MDEKNVQGEQPAGEVSNETPSEPSDEMKAEIQRLVSEQVEVAQRRFQSEKDKEIAKAQRETSEAQRRAKQYEEVLKASKGVMGELDPDVSARVRLAELEAKERHISSYEQEERSRGQHREMYDNFKNNLSQFIEMEGLDPKDKRIDWGDESEPLMSKQQRVLTSVAKIHKDESKSTEDKARERIKDLVAQERKDAGLDTVDTSTGASTTTMTAERLVKESADPEKRKSLLKNVDQIFADWKAGNIK